MSLNIFKWVRGQLYCSHCCTRESVKLHRVHDHAVKHHRWFHQDAPVPFYAEVACCDVALRLRGLDHDQSCPNWVLPL